MYILAKQRDTIARTLEPTKELDSRNVSGPLTDRRPSCRDHTPRRYDQSYLRVKTQPSDRPLSATVVVLAAYDWWPGY